MITTAKGRRIIMSDGVDMMRDALKEFGKFSLDDLDFRRTVIRGRIPRRRPRGPLPFKKAA